MPDLTNCCILKTFSLILFDHCLVFLSVYAVVEPVGELLAYRNVPLLNWVSTGQSLAYKTDLSTYFRTMAPISSLGTILLCLYVSEKLKHINRSI